MGASSDWMISLAKRSLFFLKEALPFAGAGITFLFGLTFGALCMTRPAQMAPVRAVILDGVLGFEHSLKKVFSFIPSLHQDLLDLHRAATSHRKLEEENTRLKGWHAHARMLARENDLLRQQLQLVSQINLPQVTARVIGQQRASTYHRLLLSTDAPLAVDSAVVSGRILVGYVATSGTTSAMVITTKDPSVRIPVVGEYSGKRSVVTGTGGADLSLVHTQDTKQFIPGELLLTTSEGAFYPPDYIVGRVVSQKEGGLYLQCAFEGPVPSYVSVLKKEAESHG